MKRIERAGATTKSSRLRPPNFPVAICLILLQVTGCAIQQGPDAMRAAWLGYNEAVQNSEQRDLLLNLVRLRYTDAPEFLGISSVTTQMSFRAGASIGGDFGNVENSNSAFVSPDIFVGYSESPTITFTPLRNQEFTRQLVAPVELDSLYLLSHYGCGIDRVFRLIVNDMNGQSNEITREDPDASNAESIRGFLEIALRLRQLEEKNLISIGIEQRREVLSTGIPRDRVSSDDILSALEAGFRLDYQGEPAEYFFTVDRSQFVLAVDERARDNPDFADIARLLGLPPRQATYEIDPGPIDVEELNGRLSVATGSVLGKRWCTCQTQSPYRKAISAMGLQEVTVMSAQCCAIYWKFEFRQRRSRTPICQYPTRTSGITSPEMT